MYVLFLLYMCIVTACALPATPCNSYVIDAVPHYSPHTTFNGGLPGVMCRHLSIAYIHIFKSGGTSMSDTVCRLCNVTGGVCENTQRIYKYTHLARLCDTITCISFWRDPVTRFLSGYHEVMKRYEEDHNHRVFTHLNPNAPHAEKIAKFESFLTRAEKTFFDWHIKPQASFLHYNVPARVLTTSLERALPVVLTLFCEKHMMCNNNNPTCSDILTLHEALYVRHRDRSNPVYQHAQYYLTEASLTPSVVARIVKLCHVDYLRFGIPLPVLVDLPE